MTPSSGTWSAKLSESCRGRAGWRDRASDHLLTEAREGYAYRLRAIGHLFEAEDESQEWPDLHNAIRAARKAYQVDGTLPNWEALGKASTAVRTSTR